MEDFEQDIEVLWGLYRDNSLGENVKVALIASGLDEKTTDGGSTQIEDKEFDRQMESYYGTKRKEGEIPIQQKAEEATSEPTEEITHDNMQEVEGEEPQTEGNNIFQQLKNKLESFIEIITEE